MPFRWSDQVEQLPIETTVFSMSGDAPAESDSGSDERLILFRVGSIDIDGRRELCLVKSVSTAGALLRIYSGLGSGQRLQIELKEGQPVGATVSWIRGSDAGVTFDAPVDVLDLLKTGGEGPRPRMPRVEINCVAYVREGAILRRALVHNISQGGLSVDLKEKLTIGSDVTVTLPGLPPQGALVRWTDGCRYGISFNNVLPLAGLVEWLQERATKN